MHSPLTSRTSSVWSEVRMLTVTFWPLDRQMSRAASSVGICCVSCGSTRNKAGVNSAPWVGCVFTFLFQKQNHTEPNKMRILEGGYQSWKAKLLFHTSITATERSHSAELTLNNFELLSIYFFLITQHENTIVKRTGVTIEFSCEFSFIFLVNKLLAELWKNKNVSLHFLIKFLIKFPHPCSD